MGHGGVVWRGGLDRCPIGLTLKAAVCAEVILRTFFLFNVY